MPGYHTRPPKWDGWWNLTQRNCSNSIARTLHHGQPQSKLNFKFVFIMSRFGRMVRNCVSSHYTSAKQFQLISNYTPVCQTHFMWQFVELLNFYPMVIYRLVVIEFASMCGWLSDPVQRCEKFYVIAGVDNKHYSAIEFQTESTSK